MGILKAVKIGWQALTPAEKVKKVLDLICGIGTSTVTGTVAGTWIRENPEASVATKACVFVGGVGLGGYLGEKAGEYCGEFVDACVGLHNARKELKDVKEEDIAHA